MKIVVWSSFLFVFFTYSATQAVSFYVPGIIELKVGSRSGTCTGAIVGDRPIKVLTAEHCLTNHVNGGVYIRDPRFKGNNWIASSKVFLSEDESYLKLLTTRNEKRLEIEKQKSSQNETFENLGNKAGLDEKFFSIISQIDQLRIELETVEEQLLHLYTNRDLAILIFDSHLLGEMSESERVKRGEILPLAKNTQGILGKEVILGGYGVQDVSELKNYSKAKFSSGLSHFTTNVLRLAEFPDAYQVIGYKNNNYAKRAALSPGKRGVPLQGDSGGVVLTQNGVIAVNSLISDYRSHLPPEEGWLSSSPSGSIVKSYEYIIAYFASTSSGAAQKLFDRVEREVGALVYVSEQESWSQTYEYMFEALMNSANRSRAIDLMILPEDKK